MRTFVVAPANVHPHALDGHVAQRVVQHLDVLGSAIQEFFDAAVAIHRVTTHRQVGCVDLHEQTRSDDQLVLRAHRLRHRFQIVVLRLVVVVRLEQRDDTWRCSVQESFRRRTGRGRSLHVLHIRLRRFEASNADLADAARSLIFRGRAAFRQLLQDARKLDQILSRLTRRIAGEPGDAVLDVGGIADLAHLAVAHHVDAGLDLTAHDIAYGFGNRGAPGGRIRNLAAIACEQDVGYGLRARQAADMRDQNPLGAGLQDLAPLNGTCCWRCDRRRASA